MAAVLAWWQSRASRRRGDFDQLAVDTRFRVHVEQYRLRMSLGQDNHVPPESAARTMRRVFVQLATWQGVSFARAVLEAPAGFGADYAVESLVQDALFEASATCAGAGACRFGADPRSCVAAIWSASEPGSSMARVGCVTGTAVDSC